MKNQLILIPSKKMDNNQKDGRKESQLIRIGGKARENLGLKNDKAVELWPDSDANGRINRNRLLQIFQAYSDDLKKLKESGMSLEEFNRVGFVTSNTFKYICGRSSKTNEKENTWIADTVEDTVIGADPEFLLVSKDGVVQYAAEVTGFGFEGPLGSDGPLAEIRPPPAVSVKDFIHNIKDILENDSKRMAIMPYDWMGGCFLTGQDRSFAIGGHAHIGTPTQASQLTNKYGDEANKFKLLLFSCLQKVLDEYISVPLIKVEGKEDTVQRRQHYGKFGDFRTDCGRLEYRTLSGIWLSHPKLAEAVMGSVKAVSHAFYKIAQSKDYNKNLFIPGKTDSHFDFDPYILFDQRDTDSWKTIEIVKLMRATKSSSEMIDILQKGQIRFDKAFFNSLTNRFRSLSTYKEYSGYIDAFIEIVSLPHAELTEIDRNIKHNWLEGKEFII